MDNNETMASDTHTTTSASEDSASSFSGTATTQSAATAADANPQDEVSVNANSTAQAKALKRAQVKAAAASATDIINVDEIGSDEEHQPRIATPLPVPAPPGTVFQDEASSSPATGATLAANATVQQQQQQQAQIHNQHSYWLGVGWFICPCTTAHCQCGMYTQYFGDVVPVAILVEGQGSAQAAGSSLIVNVHEHVHEPVFDDPSFPAPYLAPPLQQQHGVVYGQHTHPAHYGGAPWHGQQW